MLKLNSNYSDYTDETDVDYPEGKAVNASSSESYDGTPLLAEFMNDVNAAHIAMYEKANGSREGINGQADTQKASQFADSVAKYTDDKVKSHADERGLADGVHGATSEATAGQIASRDEFGNLKVGAAINDDDAINKGDVEAMIKVVSDAVTPVGFVYTQFPGCPSPVEMKLFGTWEELKYGGVFFRSVGGDALPFTGEFKCVAAGNSIALNADDADTLEYENLLSSCDATKLIVIAGDEYRAVTAWDRTTHTITLDSAFTDYSNITNVLIGQCDSFQGHKHIIDRLRSNDGAGKNGSFIGNGSLTGVNWYADTITEFGYGTPRVTNETRSKNVSVIYWKRTV